MPSNNTNGAGQQPISNVKRHQALDQIRRRIDEIDTQVALLLAERLTLASDVARVKTELNIPIKDSSREQEVLAKVSEVNNDKEISGAIKEIYQIVFECSRQIQQKLSTKPVPEQVAYFPRVTIVGLGLIGGVMARLIRENLPQTQIVAIDLDTGALNQAANAELIDCGETDLEKAVGHSDLVILAASPESNLGLLEELAPLLKKHQVLIDVTSVKSTIVSAAEKLMLHADFVGGHPLFGNEGSGLSGSAQVQTEGAVFCLTPDAKSSEISLRRLIRWLQTLGLKVDVIDARAHDRIVARTSHLVQLLAVAFGSQLAELMEDCGEERVAALCGPSIRQMARLMVSPAGLWSQIACQNREQIAAGAQELCQEVMRLVKMIECGDVNELQAKFAKAGKFAWNLRQY